jgi:hypothetical protein
MDNTCGVEDRCLFNRPWRYAMRLPIVLPYRSAAMSLAIAAAVLVSGRASPARAADADMLSVGLQPAATGSERTAIDPLRLTREMRLSNR